MTIKITVYGEKLDLADEITEEFHAEAKAAVGEAGNLLLAEVRRLLALRRGGPRTAAPEGQPPEQDTGALLRSFRRIPPRIRGRIASSGVQGDEEGSNRLEFGKTDVRGIRTLPHPFMAPAIANMEGPIGRLLEERLG